MNKDSKIGIVVTVIVLACVLGVSGIATNIEIGIELPTPNFADTSYKTIDEIKADNIAERTKALEEYCEQLNIAICK